MIQDIAPHTYHNEYKPVTPDGNSIILAYEMESVSSIKKKMTFHLSSTFSRTGRKCKRSVRKLYLSFFH